MSIGLIIAGWGMAVIVAMTLVWRRRREKAARSAWAREQGLELCQIPARDLLHRLSDLTLLQVGHSRRIDVAFALPGGGYALCYHCQTGFDQNRYLHAWFIAAVERPDVSDRAVITSQDWLFAAAGRPSRRELRLGKAGGSPVKTAVVEDAEGWRACLAGDCGAWLSRQPDERNWEVLPGWVVGYEPGGPEGPPLLSLAEAVREFAGFFDAKRPLLDSVADQG